MFGRGGVADQQGAAVVGQATETEGVGGDDVGTTLAIPRRRRNAFEEGAGLRPPPLSRSIDAAKGLDGETLT